MARKGFQNMPFTEAIFSRREMRDCCKALDLEYDESASALLVGLIKGEIAYKTLTSLRVTREIAIEQARLAGCDCLDINTIQAPNVR